MENYRVDHPEFQFNKCKVRVLTCMDLALVASLGKLVEHYNIGQTYMSNEDAMRQFVLFVACDLMYPVQVIPTLSNEDAK